MIKLNIISCFLIVVLLLPMAVSAQDERFFRKLYSGELKDKESAAEGTEQTSFLYTAHTPFYQLDLNRDGLPERIIFVKRDNQDWIEIFSSVKTKIFSYRFENSGMNSGLYRIEQKKLSPTTDILLLYYYAGSTHFRNTEANAQLYLLTVDKLDLTTMAVTKGPSFFEERRTKMGDYHLREYNVELLNIEKDPVKKVMVKYRGMSTVLLYQGNGKWKTFLR